MNTHVKIFQTFCGVQFSSISLSVSDSVSTAHITVIDMCSRHGHVEIYECVSVRCNAVVLSEQCMLHCTAVSANNDRFMTVSLVDSTSTWCIVAHSSAVGSLLRFCTPILQSIAMVMPMLLTLLHARGKISPSICILHYFLCLRADCVYYISTLESRNLQNQSCENRS